MACLELGLRPSLAGEFVYFELQRGHEVGGSNTNPARGGCEVLLTLFLSSSPFL